MRVTAGSDVEATARAWTGHPPASWEWSSADRSRRIQAGGAVGPGAPGGPGGASVGGGGVPVVRERRAAGTSTEEPPGAARAHATTRATQGNAEGAKTSERE